jgi:hypothetical protein
MDFGSARLLTTGHNFGRPDSCSPSSTIQHTRLFLPTEGARWSLTLSDV